MIDLTAAIEAAMETVYENTNYDARHTSDRENVKRITRDAIAATIPHLTAQIGEAIAAAIGSEPIPYGATFISTSEYMRGRAHAEIVARNYGRKADSNG